MSMKGLWKAAYWYVAIGLLVMMAAGAFGTGCQGMVKMDKRWHSNWEGLDRTISLYTDDGRLFARWNTKSYLENRTPVIAFVDSAGKEVKVSGGILVVQEK
jgi:hypothetical protein